MIEIQAQGRKTIIRMLSEHVLPMPMARLHRTVGKQSHHGTVVRVDPDRTVFHRLQWCTVVEDAELADMLRDVESLAERDGLILETARL